MICTHVVALFYESNVRAHHPQSSATSHRLPSRSSLRLHHLLRGSHEIFLHPAVGGAPRNEAIAVPLAVYGVVMYLPEALLCYLLSRHARTGSAEREATQPGLA